MADHGHEELSNMGYIRIGALAGDAGARVGEGLGMATALLPDVRPAPAAKTPEMGM